MLLVFWQDMLIRQVRQMFELPSVCVSSTCTGLAPWASLTLAQVPGNVPVMYEGATHPLDNGKNLLQTFADSDYAADETRRSTMGYVIMLNGGPIMWSSVLGKTVAMSTCEAEVNAAVSASKDALHLNRMLAELGYSNGKPLQIAEDNAACTVLLKLKPA